MSIEESINKAVCGGSEVYRALGEAHKALEEQEVRHRNEMEALRAENARWRQVAKEQDKQLDRLKGMVQGDCDYCEHRKNLGTPCTKCVHFAAKDLAQGDFWELKGDM